MTYGGVDVTIDTYKKAVVKSDFHRRIVLNTYSGSMTSIVPRYHS